MVPVGGIRFVYIVEKPGHDLDGEDTLIRAESRVDADELARQRERAWACKLRYVGRREGKKYVFDVPVETLPDWAKERVA
jgi:hypothetical protein